MHTTGYASIPAVPYPFPQSTGYQPEGTLTANRISVLDEQITSVQGATERLRSIIAEVSQFADNLFGAQPPLANKTLGAEVGFNGRANGLRTATGSLHDTINALESEISRLRAL